MSRRYKYEVFDVYRDREKQKNAIFRSAGFCENCGVPVSSVKFKYCMGDLIVVCPNCKRAKLHPSKDKKNCPDMWDSQGNLIVSF
jgi:hypothetical protein